MIMKRVFNLLVVDESGSMSIIERQALIGINETLTTIQKMQATHKNLEQRVTLITFDSTHKNLFYDNVSAKKANPLKAKDYNPCGAPHSMMPSAWESPRSMPKPPSKIPFS